MSRNILLTLGSILTSCTLAAMEPVPQTEQPVGEPPHQAPIIAQPVALKTKFFADPFWKGRCDHHIINKVAYILTVGTQRLDLSKFVPESLGYQEFCNEPTHIPLHTWISHIIEATQLSRLEVALACINISRLLEINRALKLTTLNIRRLFFISCLIATKILRDDPYFNKDWKPVCHNAYSPAQINQFEIQYLELLAFQAIPPQVIQDFKEFCAIAESFKNMAELTPEEAQHQEDLLR